jgi:uncharacterized protein YegP (UPF0339 family)
MSAIFELFRDGAGRYRFHLKSAKGEVIALSDAYPTREKAEDAINSVRHSAASAFVDDKTVPAPLAPSVGNGG